MAFFHAELDGEYVVLVNDVGKFVRVFADTQNDVGVLECKVTVMGEVKAWAWGDVFKQGVWTGLVYRVPTRVRCF